MVAALLKTALGPGGIELQDIRIDAPGPGDVKIQVGFAGICGTDLHIQDGEWPVTPPVIVGHEVSGTVLAVGDGVDPGWMRQRVVSEVWYSTDGVCELCLGGHRNLCPNRRSIGSHANGAFAEELIVPARNLHPLPDSLSLEEGALIEPLACVVGALGYPSAVSAGDRVLVTGPGAIGLLGAQVAAASGGLPTVVGTTKDEARLDIARRLGFEVLFVEEADDIARDSFDVVLECSGTPSGANLCLELVKCRGRYIQLGIFGAPATTNLSLLCTKELTMTSGYGASTWAMRRAIQLAGRTQVALRPLITRIAPIIEWEGAFRESRAGRGVKFLLSPVTRSER